MVIQILFGILIWCSYLYFVSIQAFIYQIFLLLLPDNYLVNEHTTEF